MASGTWGSTPTVTSKAPKETGALATAIDPVRAVWVTPHPDPPPQGGREILHRPSVVEYSRAQLGSDSIACRHRRLRADRTGHASPLFAGRPRPLRQCD